MTEQKKQPPFLGEENPFPNPNEDKPSFEDGMDDLRREQLEEKGEAPPPYKTIPFWVSLVATILAYLMASGALPFAVNEWVMLAVVALAHLGYGVTAKFFERSEGLHAKDGTPNWKRPSFYASFAAVMASYAMGSGFEDAATTGGQAAIILAYFGYAVRPWIRRRGMITPETQEGQMSLIQRILEIILFISRKQPLPKREEQPKKDE